MKNAKNLILLNVFLVSVGTMYGGFFKNITSLFGGDAAEASIHIVGTHEERKKQLAQMRNDLKSFEEKDEAEQRQLQKAIDAIVTEIAAVSGKIKQSIDLEKEFYQRTLALMNERHQSLLSIQFVRNQIKSSLQLLIKLIEETESTSAEEKYEVPQKAVYTFNDLSSVTDDIAGQEARFNHLQDEKNDIEVELDNGKKEFITVERAYRDKLKEQKEFSSKTVSSDADVYQQGALVDEELKLLEEKKRLVQLRIQEQSKQLALVELKHSIEEERLRHLKEAKAQVTEGLRIDELELSAEKEQLDKKRQKSLEVRERYLTERSSFVSQLDKARQALATLKEQQNAILSEYINKGWDAAPKSVQEYLVICELHARQERVSVLEKEINALQARIKLVDAEFSTAELHLMLLETWYKIKQRKFKSSEQIVAEQKRYNDKKTQAQRDVTVARENRNVATNSLNIQQKSLKSTHGFQARMQEVRGTLFKDEGSSYARCITFLKAAQKDINGQIDITSKLIEVESTLLMTLDDIVKGVTAIASELESLGLWWRSGDAISLRGISRLVPDFFMFLGDLKGMMIGFFAKNHVAHLSGIANKFISHPLSLLVLLVKVLFLLFCFFVGRRALPALVDRISAINYEYRSFVVTGKLAAALFEFLRLVYDSLFWFAVCGCIVFGTQLDDVYFKVFFYLFSIVYLCYVAARFISFMIVYNRENEYVLFRLQFERRFSIIIGLLSYSTVILLLLRQVFLLVVYAQSEFPAILLAFYSIIFRISLVLLIGKEEILQIIPEKGMVWAGLRVMIERYYDIILGFVIVVMVLSDPSVGGFGNLVSFFLWGAIGTAIFIPLLYLVHRFIRRASSTLFFSPEGEGLKERFPYAKTLYGVSIIMLFFVFVFVGIIVCAYIWGFPFQMGVIGDWFNQKIITLGAGSDQVKLSTLSVLKLFSFIPLGFVVAFIFKRYVLSRVFSLLLVDTGIHNTISSISHYVIVLLVTLVGMWIENLGFLIVYFLAPILLGIFLALKDPLNDFLAYFVILVQRAIKIGDYIQIDEHAKGVVRKITPRSVVLRRLNSYTVIVPNSKVISSTVTNWNYTTGFMTFPDIHISVSYDADPTHVIEAISCVLNESTEVLKTPVPIIRLDEFGDSGLLFLVRGYISSINTLRQWQIASNIRIALATEFRKQGIDLAYPVRVLHIMDKKAADRLPMVDEDTQSGERAGEDVRPPANTSDQ